MVTNDDVPPESKENRYLHAHNIPYRLNLVSDSGDQLPFASWKRVLIEAPS